MTIHASPCAPSGGMPPSAEAVPAAISSVTRCCLPYHPGFVRAQAVINPAHAVAKVLDNLVTGVLTRGGDTPNSASTPVTPLGTLVAPGGAGMDAPRDRAHLLQPDTNHRL